MTSAVSAVLRDTRCPRKAKAFIGASPRDATEYRLGSSGLINAPGMVAWAINGAKFKRDRKTMANIIAQGWGVPEDAALALVTERVPHTIEGEVVSFTF